MKKIPSNKNTPHYNDNTKILFSNSINQLLKNKNINNFLSKSIASSILFKPSEKLLL